MMKRRAFTATAWSGVDIALRQTVQFAVSIVLARLLSPEEFGTVALLSLFTGIATVIVDGGFSAALIQRQDITQADKSTAFWFNLGLGVLVALGLLALAPAIAAFYGLDILVPLTAVMALNVLLGSLGAVQSALLTRQLDFRTQLKIGITATTVSGAVAVAMAWRGQGVWALVAQIIVMTTVTSLLLWHFHRWRPDLAINMESARRLFGFGGYLAAASLIDVVYSRLYTLMIGKFFGVRELGYYNRADSTKQVPADALTTVLGRVAFPMFSAASHDKAALRRGVQLAIRGATLLNAPTMLGIAAVAEPLVLTLFGPRWLPAVPVLQVLCLSGVLWPLHMINLNVLMAHGDSARILRLEVPKKLLGIGLLVAGATYGMMGIAWSQVVFSVLAYFINARYTHRLLGYGPAAQFRDALPALAVSALMAIVVYGISVSWDTAPVVELAALSMAGALLFFAVGSIMRLSALQEVVALFDLARDKTVRS